MRRAGPKETEGPPVLLLHGWLASAGLNWARSFEALAGRYRVIAPDLPGHGRSRALTGARRFDMEASADALAALLARESPDQPAIIAGYSLGGMLAQTLWRRHPERVAGLVLGATSSAPIPVLRGRTPLACLAACGRETARAMGRSMVVPRAVAETLARWLEAGGTKFPARHWALQEFGAHDWPTVVDAGRAIARFDTREWAGAIDVPTSVLLTENDTLIPPAQQEALADAVAPVHVGRLAAGHLACVRADFGPAVARACRQVERAIR